VFENWVLRIIFVPKREEVAQGWTRLHNEDLHNLYASPNVIRMIKSRKMRWAGNVARMGEKIKAYKIFVAKPEGKRLLGKYMHKWEDNIRMTLREIGWEIVDWINLAQDMDHWRALVHTVTNFLVP
jgi:hypothetical protein